ncbi:MAG: prepilin-type N-terminal cleavage/methylation domain-containing protein [Verrucomicrobiae bacterium]|nr:prepilin-type N-terminal cleavage/methylation domain-containing protein [Verrucomicrobiae bacterium]
MKPLNTRHCDLRYRGFTLIELLVVVAIIALLAAILLPALQSARDRGKQASCVNNMRQIYLLSQMYRDDYNGFLPAAAVVNGSLGINTNDNASGSTGMAQLQLYHSGVRTVGFQNHFSAQHRKKFFLCPGDRRDVRRTVIDLRNVSYALNDNAWLKASGLTAGDGVRAIQPERIPLRPGFDLSHVVMFGDSDSPTAAFGLANGIMEIGVSSVPIIEDSAFGTFMQFGIMFRHDRSSGANFMFFDGHNEFVHFQTEMVPYTPGSYHRIAGLRWAFFP